MMPRLIFLDLRRPVPRPLPPPRRSVLCLGNFDGVHIAHAALLKQGIQLARERSSLDEPVLCGVFCFMRPSMDYATAAEPAAHLTTLKEKLTRMGELGVDFVCLCDFSEIRTLPPEEFITMLRQKCGCIGAVCGFNFRFGRGAAGRPETLMAAFGENTRVLPPLRYRGEVVSSTLIRKVLLSGDIETANALLGYPYNLVATVVHGKGLGHKLGFPTANQYFPSERLIPRHGVYAVLCHTPYGTLPGVANVGRHPTVDRGAQINCETYVAGFSGNLYGKIMKVELYRYLRLEMRFDSVEALTEAIRRDAACALAMLSTEE